MLPCLSAGAAGERAIIGYREQETPPLGLVARCHWIRCALGMGVFKELVAGLIFAVNLLLRERPMITR